MLLTIFHKEIYIWQGVRFEFFIIQFLIERCITKAWFKFHEKILAYHAEE